MKAVVARSELKAALLFASKDESRYVLNSVCLECQPGKKQPVLVATDGRRLAVIETEAQQEDEFETTHRMVLAVDFVKAVINLSKAFGGKLFPWAVIENNPGSKRVLVSFVGGKCVLDSEEGALIEGEFPSWRGALPARSKSREAITDIGLNAEFIGDFSKAAKALEAESQIVQMNLVGKEKQVEVKILDKPNFYGLVMQCKLQDGIDYQPEFVSIVDQLPEPPQRDDPPDEEES